MLRSTIKLFFLINIYFVTMSCLAENSQSLGETVGSILQPLGILGQLIKAVCIISGVGFIVGSAVRYKRYRQNPIEAPLSSSIMLFLTGLALLTLTLIPMPK